MRCACVRCSKERESEAARQRGARREQRREARTEARGVEARGSTDSARVSDARSVVPRCRCESRLSASRRRLALLPRAPRASRLAPPVARPQPLVSRVRRLPNILCSRPLRHARLAQPHGPPWPKKAISNEPNQRRRRRLEQARERGQVPRSPELSTFAVLLAAGGGMIADGRGAGGQPGTDHARRPHAGPRQRFRHRPA